MNRFSIGAIAAVFAAALGLTTTVSANAAQANNGPFASASHEKLVAQETSAMPADFGSPPSGEVPILFNDHHVYSKPDTLRQGRLLSALVRGKTVLVPLRSLFEQLGGTVSFDPATKTVDVSKPGSDIKVTVGKPEVEINGETRPLDVPPEIYRGAIVVPVRVISEGLGAYVQWVPDRHVVVVRYAPPQAPTPPPPPTPAPTEEPTVAPTATPTPAPTAKPVSYDHFIAGDYVFNPRVYNEFDPGLSNKAGSYTGRAAVEFPLVGLPWMVAGDFRQYQYVTAGGPVTVIGGGGQTNVPKFLGREYDFDARLGLKVADPRVYVGIGYMWRATNYGYPKMNGVEFGVEKLPDLNQPFSVYGSAYYAPSVKGNFTDPLGNQFNLDYQILKYQVGGDLTFGNSPVYLDFGYLGDRETNKVSAPSNATHNGPYAGLGVKF